MEIMSIDIVAFRKSGVIYIYIRTMLVENNNNNSNINDDNLLMSLIY